MVKNEFLRAFFASKFYFLIILLMSLYSSHVPKPRKVPQERQTVNPKATGEGQMALPLNLNDKNIPNADCFLVFKIYTFFLWYSMSGLQLKTSANNSTVLKEK